MKDHVVKIERIEAVEGKMLDKNDPLAETLISMMRVLDSMFDYDNGVMLLSGLAQVLSRKLADDDSVGIYLRCVIDAATIFRREVLLAEEAKRATKQ